MNHGLEQEQQEQQGARAGAEPRPTTVVRGGPLSWVQEWHWFERTIPAPRRVNPTPNADHCHVPPPATIADIRAALAWLTARHEALRTTVDPLRPMQHVHRADWAPLPVDCVEVPATGPDADTGVDSLEAATAALAACPIDPERRPPWLARVLIEAGKPRAVLVTAHHLVIDGWGLAVLINELYGRLCGDAAPAPAPAHPLDAVAEQPLERARAAEREWLTRLAANPTNVLAPFGGTPGGGGRHRLQYRSAAAYDDLDRVARRYGASPETVVLAALAHEVAARTGEHRLLASVVVSNRARAAHRNSVGVRALTVPVQLDLRPGAEFGEVVDSVAAACAAAYRHGQYRPAELVAAQARMDRRRGVVTVPAIEYNCYSWPRDYLTPVRNAPPDGSVAWISSASDEPCETLYVDLSRDAGVVTLDVTVGGHLLDAGQAAALPARLCGLLRALAEGAACPVPARSLVPAAPGWWRAPQGWACLPTAEAVLRGHPGVLDVSVAPGGGGTGSEEGAAPHLVAYARVVPGVSPGALHRHVLDRLGEEPGLLAPDRYVLSLSLSPNGSDLPLGLPQVGCPADQLRTTVGGAGVPAIPSRGPATEAEWALAAAVATVGGGGPPDGTSADTEKDIRDGAWANASAGPAAVDMNRCLADHGVTLVAIPRLLALLQRSGLTGIASDELAGTASLGHLAAALEPFPHGHGGDLSP
ncbi:condensation domain-containing protein [Streptomyces varsoviensis]|uniref:condensation domain-containing protein n=1 Tax=Streptomyces varsoviensis TaxID=67373 RepID=UPI0033E528AA